MLLTLGRVFGLLIASSLAYSQTSPPSQYIRWCGGNYTSGNFLRMHAAGCAEDSGVAAVAGESNTASNVGAGTFYWFYQKASSDLEFYSFDVTSPIVASLAASKITFSCPTCVVDGDMTGYQAADSDLTDFAALACSDDEIAKRSGGAWICAADGGGGTDDQTAAEVAVTPAGGIAATDVQAALEEIDSEKQAADADLTTYAGITPAANTQTLLAAADYAAWRTALGLVIGTNVQAYDADLATWATVTPSANGQSLVSAADYSAMRTALGVAIGSDVQAYSAKLATVAGLSCSDAEVVGGTAGGSFECQADSGSGGGYATVDDEDTPLTQRTTLNFEGGGITCADDTDQTTCTVPVGALPTQTGNAYKQLSTDGSAAFWQALGLGLVSDATSLRVDSSTVALLSGTQTIAGDKTLTGDTTFAGEVDASGGTFIPPSGTSLPGTCAADVELFVDSDATDGQQLYICNAAGTGWNLVGDGGGTPGADLVGTGELDDAADTPSAGEYVVVASTTTDVEYVAPGTGTVVGIQLVIGNGTDALSTGVAGYLEIPFACTINQITGLADQSGSAVVDVWKDTYANYPPTDADSITASAPLTLSTATKAQDATLTGWTTTISAGDILGFNVDSAATITQLTVSLKCTR